MSKIAIIGAGPMGLTLCYRLLKMGHQVTLYEADDRIGGMSASFNFGGINIERYYHFICRSDTPFFELLKELGIEDSLQWQDTYMGYYYQHKTQDWGDPISLLKFSGLSFTAKLRYGIMAFTSTKRKRWHKLDKKNAVSWLENWVGTEAYNILWAPLFSLKFYHFTDNLSAAWIWTRLKRVGTSRRHLFQESLGYLEGGSDTYLNRIADEIHNLAGTIKLSSPVTKVNLVNGKAHSLTTAEGETTYDKVVSTIPTPYVPAIIPDLPTAYIAQYKSLKNIAVVCVLVRLKKPLTKYFWLNISDKGMDIPGLVEYSRLRPLQDNIVYVPFYLPGDHPKYKEPDENFINKVKSYLFQITPSLTEDDIITIKAGRYLYAQPICPPEFLTQLPPISPGIENLFVADTSYYYPEDRSISESIKLANKLAIMAGSN